MKLRKRTIFLAMLTLLMLSLCACADEGQSKKGGNADYRIGIIQFIQHPALDRATEGFKDAIKESGLKVDIDEQNASGEQPICKTIAGKFVNDGMDLIYAVATPAAQAVSSETEEIPIIISAVTDPESSGLVESNERPGCNVTGTSDLTPVKEQIALIKKIMPEAKTVGILYSTAESNSAFQVELAKKACEEQGLVPMTFSVSTSNEIQTVTMSMVGKVDVIYTPTDNTIAAGMATVASVATEHGIPIISGEEGQLEDGGMVSYGIDYYTLGYIAGEQAISILKDGKDIKEMPIEYLPADKCKLAKNEEAAKELGIDLSVLDKDN